MKTNPLWHGVRMRNLQAGADPDSDPRPVSIPVSWEDDAAAALAALAPGCGAVSLPQAAEAWIRPIAHSAARAGLADLSIADRLHSLLLQRRGAPDAGIWRGAPDTTSGFILNLPAFYHPSTGFDVDGFIDAVKTATTALALALPACRHLRVAISDLAGLLAMMGVEYASAEARGVAACVAALLRGHADLASSALPIVSTAHPQEWPAPPSLCMVPGLAMAARQIHAQAPVARHRTTTAILPPNLADALLGIETSGIAPAFSPLAADGGLSRTARSWLGARGIAVERALAGMLAGDHPFPQVSSLARASLCETVALYVQDVDQPGLLAATSHAPPLPRPLTRPLRRPLPARRGGYTQRVAIGGHKLYLRTGEYDDAQLGEISIAVPKDGASARGLMDALCAAISLGLQHGVALNDFVELFINTRFGASGGVDGDPSVTQASSVLDYAMRHLAVHYLGRTDLPPVVQDESDETPSEKSPLLPLDLPRNGRRLRLVNGDMS